MQLFNCKSKESKTFPVRIEECIVKKKLVQYYLSKTTVLI